jgi:hypothetical protein
MSLRLEVCSKNYVPVCRKSTEVKIINIIAYMHKKNILGLQTFQVQNVLILSILLANKKSILM